MSDEQAFLASIRYRPEDRSRRLVYADWLEERGDRRAELIRIEERMRDLPIYSDSYWQLKPRRNELRDQCSKQWLEEMKFGTNYEPVFREVPDGWRERWRLLREFNERWHGFPMGDVGGSRDAVSETEERLNLSLPSSVQEWIAFVAELGNTSFAEMLAQHDYLLQFDRLNEILALSLIFNRDGNCYLAMRTADLHHLDPPVNGFDPDYASYPESRLANRGVVSPRLTSLVLQLLHFCFPLIARLAGGFMNSFELTPALLKQLAQAFPVYVQVDGISVFESANIVALHLPRSYFGYYQYPRLEVKVRHEAALEEVPTFLWDYVHPQGHGTWGIFTPEELN
jgi:uncharacterized protein (TIGR02996 family)